MAIHLTGEVIEELYGPHAKDMKPLNLRRDLEENVLQSK